VNAQADIRQFVLMAADKIHRFPKQFDFWMCSVPSSPNDCGCALGWIGYFADMRDEAVSIVSEKLLGIDGGAFYGRMDGMNIDWAYSSSVCAATLRRYADTYLPAQSEQREQTSGVAP
jgi:hypothetical protein